jgi:hypothetical protein
MRMDERDVISTEDNEAIRPDLKRTLKDLLVQDEVSDSDIEMLEKNSQQQNDKLEGEDDEPLDPDMCVECGDQVISVLTELT